MTCSIRAAHSAAKQSKKKKAVVCGPAFVKNGTNPTNWKLFVYSGRGLWSSSGCKCASVFVSPCPCVCFVIGRQWEQVQRFTCTLLLIPSSISQSCIFFPPPPRPVNQFQASTKRQPDTHTQHSHRLPSELSTTSIRTFHRAVCLPAIPLCALKLPARSSEDNTSPRTVSDLLKCQGGKLKLHFFSETNQ